MHTEKKIATFRDRFEELFEDSGKTTTELAKELRVSNQTISAWKTGKRSPKEPTIITIAEYFNVDVRWLMGFDVKKEKGKNTSFYYFNEPISQLIHRVCEEDDVIQELWIHASQSAKRAAIAVLKTMEKEDP